MEHRFEPKFNEWRTPSLRVFWVESIWVGTWNESIVNCLFIFICMFIKTWIEKFQTLFFATLTCPNLYCKDPKTLFIINTFQNFNVRIEHFTLFSFSSRHIPNVPTILSWKCSKLMLPSSFLKRSQKVFKSDFMVWWSIFGSYMSAFKQINHFQMIL